MRQLTVSAEAESDEIDVDSIVMELERDFLPRLVEQYTGMNYVKSGNARQQEEDARNIRFNTILVILGVYVLLAIPFKSYVKPFVVMAVIPFGIVGAILGHVIMDWILGAIWDDGVTVNIMSQLGFLALSGVVVNDSLIMVHFISARVKEGVKLGEAVRAAGVRRFRPFCSRR